MKEYIIKFMTEKPLTELKDGDTVSALMKTVGDCDELIRCKNCAYWDEYEPNLDLTDFDESVIEEIKGRRHCWVFQGALMGPNDYCSCARKKND